MKIVVINENRNNQQQQIPTKSILLLGANGHGKTSLIDSMCNYLYDVKIDDDFRLIISDRKINHDTVHESLQTTKDRSSRKLTKYIFENSRLSYRLVIVDSPGIDQVDLIQSWMNEDIDNNNQLNAICLVIKATECHLNQQLMSMLQKVLIIKMFFMTSFQGFKYICQQSSTETNSIIDILQYIRTANHSCSCRLSTYRF
jgi:GTPase SAR1 family protein